MNDTDDGGMKMRIANVISIIGLIMFLVTGWVLHELGIGSNGWPESWAEAYLRLKILVFAMAPWPAIAYAIRYILVGRK